MGFGILLDKGRSFQSHADPLTWAQCLSHAVWAGRQVWSFVLLSGWERLILGAGGRRLGVGAGGWGETLEKWDLQAWPRPVGGAGGQLSMVLSRLACALGEPSGVHGGEAGVGFRKE